MDAVAVGLGLWLVPASGAALYYFALTLLGWTTPRPTADGPPHLHVTVLIPAHDEERTVPDAIRSVAASVYPADLLRVVVVADNCTDGTAAVVRGLGAACVERFDAGHRGKGFALALGFDRILETPTDVVMVVDADCELSPLAVRRLVATLEAGADVAQSSVITRNPQVLPAGLIAGVGGQLENAVAAGLDRLGYPTGLRGTGMAFRRAVLEAHPWDAYGLTEDAEYAGRLRRAGVAVRFVLDAEVRSEAPPTAAAFGTQRERWRAALFTPGFGIVHKLLSSKPLVLAHLAATLAGVVAALPWLPTGRGEVAAVWAGALVLLTALPYLYAIRRGDYETGGFVGMVRSVVLTARLVLVTVGSFKPRDRGWQRTLRVAEAPARSGA
jgi:GT2 family glycosyltransferase